MDSCLRFTRTTEEEKQKPERQTEAVVPRSSLCSFLLLYFSSSPLRSCPFKKTYSLTQSVHGVSKQSVGLGGFSLAVYLYSTSISIFSIYLYEYEGLLHDRYSRLPLSWISVLALFSSPLLPFSFFHWHCSIECCPHACKVRLVGPSLHSFSLQVCDSAGVLSASMAFRPTAQ